MDDKPKPDEPEHPEINAIGAGGQSADPFVGKIVSGQPAGGPDDVGERASEENES